MKNVFDSIYSEYASQTVDWIWGDTQDAYEKNLQSRKHLLEKYNWLDNKVTYTFNSNGFRCEEFVDSPSVLFLGCSFTLGLGVNTEQTWPQLVADKLNLKCFNLGQAGGSNDTTFRLGQYWINKLIPKVVVLLTPSDSRFELIEPDMIHFLTPIRFHEDRFTPWHSAWLSSSVNTSMNALKNALALEHICNTLNIKFVKQDASHLKNLDFARDLSHPGVKAHKQLASNILDLVSRTGIEPA